MANHIHITHRGFHPETSICLLVCGGKGPFSVGGIAKGWGVLAATPSARHAGLCEPLLALPGHPAGAMGLSRSHRASCYCLQTEGSAGVQADTRVPTDNTRFCSQFLIQGALTLRGCSESCNPSPRCLLHSSHDSIAGNFATLWGVIFLGSLLGLSRIQATAACGLHHP